MGADGSKGPKPWSQHQARTLFLRVPLDDWPAVKRGIKTEFRGQPGALSGLKFVDPPAPVVAYSYSRMRGYDSALMVLEDRMQEPLMAISEESLRREGHESVAHFRRYWMARERKRFNPMAEIVAYRIRPWLPDDVERFARRLLERLYGDHLPQTAPSEEQALSQ